jgi:hypothetical protein
MTDRQFILEGKVYNILTGTETELAPPEEYFFQPGKRSGLLKEENAMLFYNKIMYNSDNTVLIY